MWVGSNAGLLRIKIFNPIAKFQHNNSESNG